MNKLLPKLGIIAGKGQLPVLLAKKATEKGFYPVIVALEGFADSQDFADYDCLESKMGEAKKIFEFFKQCGATNLIFSGRVERPKWSDLFVDKVGALLLARVLKNKLLGDNSIMQIINEFVQEYGFKIISALEIMPFEYGKGALGVLKPTDSDLNDIGIGFNVAKAIGKFDVGQGVIVENACVLGVEGLEGTNKLIKRCQLLKRSEESSGVLVKVAKPGQNLALDPPTIGPSTVENIYSCGFKGIAIEAGSVVIVEAKQVVELADKLKIFIWAI